MLFTEPDFLNGDCIIDKHYTTVPVMGMQVLMQVDFHSSDYLLVKESDAQKTKDKNLLDKSQEFQD